MSSPDYGRAKHVSERTVEILIQNNSKSKVLTDAATFNYSGHLYNPPPPVISPGEKGDAMFIKTRGAARGSVGILTFKYGSNQFSVLFSNPFDYNIFSIEYALYISGVSEQTDKYLYRKMYSQMKPQKNYAKEVLSARTRAISVSGGGLVVSATMSNESHSIIKIDVRDT
ncbi:DELTA-sagatoxin-Srs1a-like [Scyliorhinus canicula]|uniref:DELTA-sagatoxin-Srs1a-like n=1 Tax=Scyliorhinus canicula TaxID=7830 RepID=UPI0018F3167C|nr:DELTA-sagatoxin-Srs1a-like [Scyliorhinus canicula]XP_038676899.1 DELTA-sagatoxin-Srs1a-like [Scyliorhinus canicula]